MLSSAYKRFDGVMPEPGELDAVARALLEKVEAGFEIVGELDNACEFHAVLGEALAPAYSLDNRANRGSILSLFPGLAARAGRRTVQDSVGQRP